MNFPGAAARLASALRPRGAWYMSYKLGLGERVAGGRNFTDHTAETLQTALAGVPVQLLDSWTSEDARPDRVEERWANAIGQRR